MNIVIPMAGRGSRLSSDPSGLPKPLIEVHGRPLWSWAVDCLPLTDADRIVFVCLGAHLDDYGVDRAILEELAGLPVVIHRIEEVTDGQLRTVVAASDSLLETSPLVIFNADTWFRHDQRAFLALVQSSDGVLGVSSKPGDRWSFVRLDEHDAVVEVVEERRISDHVCTGLYHFADTRRFLEDADAMFALDQRTNGEFFVAPIYQRMIDRGERVRIMPASSFQPIGTPTELEEFRSTVDG